MDSNWNVSALLPFRSRDKPHKHLVKFRSKYVHKQHGQHGHAVVLFLFISGVCLEDTSHTQAVDHKLFLFFSFSLFCSFSERTDEGLDRKWGRERGNDMQQRTTWWNRTGGHCSKDAASVHGALALSTELTEPQIFLVLNKFSENLGKKMHLYI